MSGDYWGDFEALEFEDNRALDIIREQSNLISKKTDGVVKGSFGKITYTTTQMESTILGFAAVMAKASDKMPKKTEISDLSDREDINNLYIQTHYKFEIYSDEYKFRVFTLSYSEEYPNYITADEGIREELRLPERMEVRNNNEIIEVLQKILSAPKLINIISRMIAYSRNEYEKRIVDYLSDHPGASAKEIADAMNWSKANTTKRLTVLEQKELIKKNNNTRENKWIVV